MKLDYVIDIFRRVLETPRVDAESDFFEMGGDSLLATRVLSAIARDFGTELDYDEFIDDPTPGGLAAKLAAVVA